MPRCARSSPARSLDFEKMNMQTEGACESRRSTSCESGPTGARTTPKAYSLLPFKFIYCEEQQGPQTCGDRPHIFHGGNAQDGDAHTSEWASVDPAQTSFADLQSSRLSFKPPSTVSALSIAWKCEGISQTWFVRHSPVLASLTTTSMVTGRTFFPCLVSRVV